MCAKEILVEEKDRRNLIALVDSLGRKIVLLRAAREKLRRKIYIVSPAESGWESFLRKNIALMREMEQINTEASLLLIDIRRHFQEKLKGSSQSSHV